MKPGNAAYNHPFRATDQLPPMNGPMFAAEDVDDLGVELCLTVWQRIQKPKRGISLDEFRRSLDDEREISRGLRGAVAAFRRWRNA